MVENLAAHPVLTSFDQLKVELIGAVDLAFEGTAQVNIDISVPAPGDALEDDQYIATQIVNFRGSDEQTLVDVASYDAGSGLVTTEFVGGLPLIVTSGLLGIHRANECLAYATGFAKIGDAFTNGVIPGGVLGASLPFAVTTTALKQFTVPVPCNQSLTIEITDFTDQPIDDKPCGPAGGLSRGESCQLLGPLSDDENPPIVQDTSVLEGGVGVDPLAPLEVVYSESMDPGSVIGSCEVTDGAGHGVSGKCNLSADGRVLSFLPDTRLRFDESYTFRVQGVTDLGGNLATEDVSASFRTFKPLLLGHIPIDARDVAWLEPEGLGLAPCDDVVVVAEGNDGLVSRDGGGQRPDFEGGVSFFDVTDLTVDPVFLSRSETAGVDRGVFALAGEASITTTGEDAATFDGPFLASVDGPRGRETDSAPGASSIWSAFPEITPVASRLINQSARTFAALNTGDPTTTVLGTQIELVPNELGVPIDIAGFGTQVSYVANIPFIGLQAVVLDGLNSDVLAVPQVDATLAGQYRAVDAAQGVILAVEQEEGGNSIDLIDPDLSGVLSSYDLPRAGRPADVSLLTEWLAFATQESEAPEPLDLAIAVCGSAVCVVPVDLTSRTFAPTLLDRGVGEIEAPGGDPVAIASDRDRSLLYVAGWGGLHIVDLLNPGGGMLDENADEVDDRVLSTTQLGESVPQSIAHFVSRFGEPVVAVTVPGDGVYLVQVGPAVIEEDTGSGASLSSVANLSSGAMLSAAAAPPTEGCGVVELHPKCGVGVDYRECAGGLDLSDPESPWLVVPFGGGATASFITRVLDENGRSLRAILGDVKLESSPSVTFECDAGVSCENGQQTLVYPGTGKWPKLSVGASMDAAPGAEKLTVRVGGTELSRDILVDVRKERVVTVRAIFLSDAGGHAGTRTVANTDLDVLIEDINKIIFGPQLNVRLKKSEVLPVATIQVEDDLGPVLESWRGDTNPVLAAIDDLPDIVDVDLVFAWEVESRELADDGSRVRADDNPGGPERADAFLSGGVAYFDDDICGTSPGGSDFPTTIAHEIGHWLRLVTRNTPGADKSGVHTDRNLPGHEADLMSVRKRCGSPRQFIPHSQVVGVEE